MHWLMPGKIPQKLQLNSTTPDPQLQIIAIGKETHSQPLDIVLIAVSLPSSLVEEIIIHRETFTNVPSESQIEEAFVNDSPSEEQQQPCQEAPVAEQSEEEAQLDLYVLLLIQIWAGKESSPRKTEPEPPLIVLGISPPISQPTPSASQPIVTQLEALKFAQETSVEPSLTTSTKYKTLEKEKEITEELKKKCYHWMTQVKKTKDTTNEYDATFILNHEADLEGLRHHFLSLMPGEDVDYTNFMLGHGKNYIDQNSNKAYRIDINQYAHYLHYLDKRKLASHLFIADVKMKAFCVLDLVNKMKDKIPDLRIKLNKFVARINSLPDEDLCWGRILNRGRRGSRSRIYQAQWSTNKEEIDAFRCKYGPNVLFHKMNKIRDQVIWTSEVIRLPKPSAALPSLFVNLHLGI
ncbi:hypothetical protein Ahy_A06g028736 [Arachis hypogaea]|uniref:Uncharacterized protein n=1 Tax=Arachis hypogaea TaxID=3818 RepID=A0A445CRG9_ARAHY|nr:hypothetical protein Ahy_A06g028736 [Arachis hypogaea]